MKQKFFSLVALIAFVTTLASAGIAELATSQQFIWKYIDGTTTMGQPDCEDATVACAYLHYFDPSQEDNVGELVLDEEGNPIQIDGIKRVL